MRYNIFFVSLVLLALVSWVKLSGPAYPPPPQQYKNLSKTVNLRFKVIASDINSVEMALNEGGGANNMFVVFDLAENWGNGSFGLILKNMSEQATLPSRGGRKPDISRFEKDKNGRPVEFYSFSQELVQDNNGTYFIKMLYTGPEMPLIESLTVSGDFRLPRHLSARFVNNGSIEFLAGRYGLDNSIGGFWIPVRVSS